MVRWIIDGGVAPNGDILPLPNFWIASPVEPQTASAAPNSSAVTPMK